MNNRKTTLLLFVLLLCSALAHADPFQSAMDAYIAGNYQEAFRLFKEMAEQGNPIAQSELGAMYASGMGVPEDDREAVAWYRRAAEQGDAMAQFNLGVMYKDGEGVPEDDKQAVTWFHKSAEQGYAPAQYNLGAVYAN